jgi:hypothetical protein
MRLLALLLTLAPLSALADDFVRGYQRPDGRYVAPYLRTPANGLTIDNYSGAPRYPAQRLDYPRPQPLTADEIARPLMAPSAPSYRYAPVPFASPFVMPATDDDDDDDD